MGVNSSKSKKLQKIQDDRGSQRKTQTEFPVTTSPLYCNSTIQNGFPIICHATNQPTDNPTSVSQFNSSISGILHCDEAKYTSASNLLFMKQSAIVNCNKIEEQQIEMAIESALQISKVLEMNDQYDDGAVGGVQSMQEEATRSLKNLTLSFNPKNIREWHNYDEDSTQNSLSADDATASTALSNTSNFIIQSNVKPSVAFAASVELIIDIYMTTSHLRTTFDRKVYDIYYLDLYEDEYKQLETHWFVRLRIDKDNLQIDNLNDHLSIRRIIEPTKALPNCFVNKKEMFDTDCISFSECEPLIAKYRNQYYFVHDDLYEEYMYLLEISGCLLGTSIRLRNDRILANDRTHFLDIKCPLNRYQPGQPIYIIGSYQNSKSKFRAVLGNFRNTMQRYVLNPYENNTADRSQLLIFPLNLIYGTNDGDGDEIYAENDYGDMADTELQKYDFLGTFDRQRELKVRPLPKFPVDVALKELIQYHKKGTKNGNGLILSTKAQNISEFYRQFKRAELNAQNYSEYLASFHMMIQLEDENEREEFAVYNQINCEVLRESSAIYYTSIQLMGELLEPFVGAVASKDIYLVRLKLMNEMAERTRSVSNRKKNSSRTIGKVLRIRDGKLYIEIEKRLTQLGADNLYSLEFLHTRLPFQMSRQALKYIEKQQLHTFLFPSGPFGQPIGQYKKENKSIKWFDPNLNKEQMTAVHNIIMKTSSPYPFILFGPPGTGKTKTIVEAIAQIATNSTDKILVCATSNAACDVIASRLTKIIPQIFIYRMYSTMANVEEIDKNVRYFSNVSDGDAFYPALENLATVQILICTLVVAGRLGQANIARNYPSHFTYVFIDECASSDEPSALIPIAAINSTKNYVAANVILAGDPNQLRAVIKSRMATNMGFDISLMERLIKIPPYRQNNYTFNDRYIVFLIENYRSHSAILYPSNELFYGSKLVPKAPADTINLFIDTIILPNVKFPVLFKSVQGKCKRDRGSPSLYNNEELREILSFVQQLQSGHNGVKRHNIAPMRKMSQSDIGIISPYKKQCRNISNACRHNGWNNIKVGPVEVFQGQENPVIIVSTVRSDMNSIGFLDNWRRLNVLMTRAKCLLILIGDPFTLQIDSNWAYILKYLQDNKAIVQSKRPFKI